MTAEGRGAVVAKEVGVVVVVVKMGEEREPVTLEAEEAVSKGGVKEAVSKGGVRVAGAAHKR